MQVAAVSALVLTALLACTPNPKSQPAPAPAATSAQPRPSPPPPPAPAAAPSVRLTPGAAHSVRFVSDLIGLADGKRLTRDAFDHAAVVVKRVSARAAVEKQRLLVLLDDQTPRPLLTWTAPLTSVVDEDRELGPGWHVLAVALVEDAGVEVQVVRFVLELEGAPEEAAPGCVLLAPGGTVYATAGDALELVGLALSPGVRRFEYFVAGVEGSSLRVPGLEGALAHGLEAGDHRLGVRCYDAGGGLVGESSRTVTLNLRPAQAAAGKGAAP